MRQLGQPSHNLSQLHNFQGLHVIYQLQHVYIVQEFQMSVKRLKPSYYFGQGNSSPSQQGRTGRYYFHQETRKRGRSGDRKYTVSLIFHLSITISSLKRHIRNIGKKYEYNWLTHIKQSVT